VEVTIPFAAIRAILLFFSLSTIVAALILAACGADVLPEDAMQTRPGIDIHLGHRRLNGFVARNFGFSVCAFSIVGTLFTIVCLLFVAIPRQDSERFGVEGGSRVLVCGSAAARLHPPPTSDVCLTF
jgi:hypothetical protein